MKGIHNFIHDTQLNYEDTSSIIVFGFLVILSYTILTAHKLSDIMEDESAGESLSQNEEQNDGDDLRDSRRELEQAL